MATRTYTLEELRRMPRAKAELLLKRATKIEGTAVVRKADGSIKYDDPASAGQYGEHNLWGKR